jgi:hypothetical protein
VQSSWVCNFSRLTGCLNIVYLERINVPSGGGATWRKSLITRVRPSPTAGPGSTAFGCIMSQLGRARRCCCCMGCSQQRAARARQVKSAVADAMCVKTLLRLAALYHVRHLP